MTRSPSSPTAGRWPAAPISNCATPARSGASAMSAIATRLRRSRTSTCRNSAATTRSASPAAWRSPATRMCGSSPANGSTCSTIVPGWKSSPVTPISLAPRPNADGLTSSVHSVLDRRRVRRIAPGQESRDEQGVGAVDERPAIRRGHAAAGGFEDGVAGRDIPVRGRRQPRINVGCAFGEAAEFYRRAALYEFCCRQTVDIAFGARFEMRAADHDDGFACGPRPGADRDGHAGVGAKDAVGTAADDTAPEDSERRRADDAEQGCPFSHERDIDRIFVTAGDEFPRAVEWVDQKVAAARYRLRLFARGLLLRNDRHRRIKPFEAIADDGFGGFVG